MTTLISIISSIVVFSVVAVIVLKIRKPAENSAGTVAEKPAGETAGTVTEKPAGNSAGTAEEKPAENSAGTGTAADACVVELPGTTNDVLYQQVCFSDDVCGQWVSAYYCSDVADGEFTLQTTGDLYVKLKVKCSKGKLDRKHFTLSIDDHKAVTPNSMFDGALYKKDVIELKKQTAEEIVLYFKDAFGVLGRQFERANKNASWSIDIRHNGKDLFACDVYAMKGERGWVSR